LELLSSEIETLKILPLEGLSLILPHVLKIIEDNELFECDEEACHDILKGQLQPNRLDLIQPENDIIGDSNSHIHIANTAIQQANFVEKYIHIIDTLSSRLGPETTNYVIIPKVLLIYVCI
jgi:hypothetical protein